MSSTKLRILCLHGCRQDAKIFSQKTGHLRKMLKNFAEFEFISAPHSITHFDPEDSYDYRSWWYSGSDKSYNSSLPSETDEGFEESVKLVEMTLKENGPFDGILAFSQGASLLGMICLMKERKEFVGDFKFVVLFSGFTSPCIPHQKYYTPVKLNIPSLHLFGDEDKIILKERSIELMSFFSDPEVINHPGGHHVPASKAEKEAYQNFFKKQLLIKNGVCVETLN